MPFSHFDPLGIKFRNDFEFVKNISCRIRRASPWDKDVSFKFLVEFKQAPNLYPEYDKRIWYVYKSIPS